MRYNNFSYIYPCRPKNAAPIQDIIKYDNGMMLCQPKYNGSNCTIFTNGIETKVFNRHKDKLTNFNLTNEDIIQNIFKGEVGKWMVINGEYLNKNKNDERGLPFNHKLIIFDILVYESDYLIGKSFADRVELLDNLYGIDDSEKNYLFSVSNNIYRTKTYQTNFVDLYTNLSKIDMIEGLVLKRLNAKLELGITEDNNSKSQIKFRKKCANYLF